MASEVACCLTPEDLSCLWGVTVGTLANWRAAKPRKGPRFLKIGNSVRYLMRDVIDYERRRRK